MICAIQEFNIHSSKNLPPNGLGRFSESLRKQAIPPIAYRSTNREPSILAVSILLKTPHRWATNTVTGEAVRQASHASG